MYITGISTQWSAAAAAASVVSNSMRPHRRKPARLPHPWDSPGKNTGVGCHSLPQGIFLTQGSNPLSLMSPALAGGFLTTSDTWGSPIRCRRWLKTTQVRALECGF